MDIFKTAQGMFARNCWNTHNTRLAKAVERLSSGKRINRAADDPAGIGISERMRAQLTLISRQQDNAADSILAAQTADGILQGMQDSARRLVELATMAASGTLDVQDRKNLDIEYQSLLEEINNSGATIKHQATDLFQSPMLGDWSDDSATSAEPITFRNIDLADYLDALDDFMQSGVSLTGSELRSAVVDFTNQYMESAKGNSSMFGGYSITITSRNITLEKERFSTDRLGLTGTNLLTQKDAAKALEAATLASQDISRQRAEYGALQNRLEHRSNSLTAMEQGLTDAYSRLTDADMAKEFMIYTRESMLAQAASYMMVHVRQSAYQVLDLLQ